MQHDSNQTPSDKTGVIQTRLTQRQEQYSEGWHRKIPRLES